MSLQTAYLAKQAVANIQGGYNHAPATQIAGANMLPGMAGVDYASWNGLMRRVWTEPERAGAGAITDARLSAIQALQSVSATYAVFKR